VVRAIELDGEVRTRTVEVEDEVAVRVLTTEPAAHRLPAERTPERHLLRCHLDPELSAALPDVVASASHSECPNETTAILR
jgi:acetamidase/formamidase